jgi:hypothetical protein
LERITPNSRGSVCSENQGVNLLRKGRGQFAPNAGGQFDRILQSIANRAILIAGMLFDI